MFYTRYKTLCGCEFSLHIFCFGYFKFSIVFLYLKEDNFFLSLFLVIVIENIFPPANFPFSDSVY